MVSKERCDSFSLSQVECLRTSSNPEALMVEQYLGVRFSLGIPKKVEFTPINKLALLRNKSLREILGLSISDVMVGHQLGALGQYLSEFNVLFMFQQSHRYTSGQVEIHENSHGLLFQLNPEIDRNDTDFLRRVMGSAYNPNLTYYANKLILMKSKTRTGLVREEEWEQQGISYIFQEGFAEWAVTEILARKKGLTEVLDLEKVHTDNIDNWIRDDVFGTYVLGTEEAQRGHMFLTKVMSFLYQQGIPIGQAVFLVVTKPPHTEMEINNPLLFGEKLLNKH